MHRALTERLDQLRWNRFHSVVSVALGIGWLLDAFEVTIVNNVIGVLKGLWHLSNVQASWILSVWFLGLMVGAAVFGYLADRYGRKRLFLLTLTLYGVFTLLTAFSPNYAVMLVLRLATAIGVGAEYAAINAAIAEFVPARHRGKTNATVMNFWSLGSIFAAVATLVLVNRLPPDLGWRVVFGFGALIAASTVVLRRYIPESPRWLIEQGRPDAAQAVIESIARGGFGPLRDTVPAAPSAGRRQGFFAKSRTLVVDHPGRLALGCLLDFSEAAGYYGLFAFLPLFILPALHVRPGFFPVFYLIGNVGALIGGIAAAYLLDRIGRRLTVPAFYLLAAVGVLVLAASASRGQWDAVLAAFTIANLFATGAWISGYPTFSELFPTELRSTGIGLSVAFGRIGAFAAPLVLTLVATAAGMTAALTLLAAFWLIGFAAMIPWYFHGVEGRHAALEELLPGA